MTPPITRTAALLCHPDTPTEAVRGIEVDLKITERSLALRYSLTGDLAQLRIPPPGSPRRTDRLWQHSCFEAFVASKSNPGYLEFNFSPSGEWAAYAFRGYREGARAVDEAQDPGITARKVADRLEVSAAVRLEDLPAGEGLQFALCAVVEEMGGALSYWALRHPSGKPDFHHPEAFALELQ